MMISACKYDPCETSIFIVTSRLTIHELDGTVTGDIGVGTVSQQTISITLTARHTSDNKI